MGTIVVLDDDRITLALLDAVIRDSGHEVVGASTLEGLPSAVRPDLVITDLVPLTSYRRETASDWIRLLRSRFPQTPIVVVTAHAAAVAEADRLGADLVIGKPFDVEALSASVDDLLHRR